MYGIFTYVYRKFEPNVGKYPTHGSYGMERFRPFFFFVAQINIQEQGLES